MDPRFVERGKMLACLQVTDLDDIPTDMVAKALPNNTYAVFTHRGRSLRCR